MRFWFVATLALIPIIQSELRAAPVDFDETIIRRLIVALKDSDPDVRQNISIALAKVGPAAVELLIATLKSKESSTEQRAGVAYTLGQIGSPARAALPALLDALEDADLDVRRQASYAISRLIPAPKPMPLSSTPLGAKLK